METIQEKYPHALIYFVAGGDKLKVMSRWHRKEEFLEKFRILVVKREDSSPEAIIDKISFLNQHRDAFALLKEPVGLEGISSSKVRDLLRRGDEKGKTLVHPGVWKLLLEDGRLETGITSFRGDYHFLSNFYESPLEYEGLRYQNAEAAFQAQKCTDDGEKAEFCSLAANKAKRLGRQVKLREDWEEVKTGLMLQIVRAKFAQNPELAGELLRTGDRKLIEGNTWHDVFWGMDLNTGQGENHLGRDPDAGARGDAGGKSRGKTPGKIRAAKTRRKEEGEEKDEGRNDGAGVYFGQKRFHVRAGEGYDRGI